MKLKNKVLTTVAVAGGLLAVGSKASAAKLPVLDLSEWQGTITQAQAKKLKSEVQGVILRVQYGSNYKDKTFAQNAATLKKAGVKFGVYTFSQYVNAADAKVEAKDFYNRAKSYSPSFYVNDAEELTTTSGSYAAATKAWAEQMKKLTKKPLVLYSYRSFYNSYIKSKSGYNKFWLAAYQSSTPTPKDYQLWQYTDARYSLSLGKSTDASKVISGDWFGSTIDKSKYTVGGFKVGETVRLKAAKWYTTGKAVDKALIGQDVHISAVRTAYTGKSNQLVTVVRNGVVLGILRAQDVAGAYYQSKTTQFYQARRATNYYKKTGYKERAKAIKAGDVFVGKAVKVGSHWEIKTPHGYVTANKRAIKLL